MAIYTQPNLTGGIDSNLVQIVSQVPSYTVGLLLFVWGVVFIAGSGEQKRRGGYADMPMWAIMASLSTLMVALILTLIPGLINLTVLSAVVGITIMSGVWLFLSKGRGEF